MQIFLNIGQVQERPNAQLPLPSGALWGIYYDREDVKLLFEALLGFNDCISMLHIRLQAPETMNEPVLL